MQSLHFGPTQGWTWGNGTYTNRTFDLDGKLTQVDSAGLNAYAFDDAFRITVNTDTSNSALSWSYGYSALDQLTSASKTALTQSWTFDANGNRLTEGGTASSAFTHATTSNRLSSVTGVLARTYSYDNAGNTLSDGSRTFTYNAAGRMITATHGGITTSYAYNALGQRVKKTSTNGTTYFVYDEAGHLIGEYDQTGALIQEIVWLNDIPVASIRIDQGGSTVGVFYIHTDHLNAPTKITRPTNNEVIWRWDHDPYGNGTPNQDPDGNGLQLTMNLRFPGQYADQETGLYYNWNRYFDPQTGRYITSDPIGLDGGLNTYAYVGGNPISQADSTGLFVDTTGQFTRVCVAASSTALRAVSTTAIVVAGLFVPNANEGGQCSDFTPRPEKENVCEDDKCRKAISDARRIYNDLQTKRIPQYMYGVRHGMDEGSPGHYAAVQQKLAALQEALGRVRLYCQSMPVDMAKMEQAASQSFPNRHGEP